MALPNPTAEVLVLTLDVPDIKDKISFYSVPSDTKTLYFKNGKAAAADPQTSLLQNSWATMTANSGFVWWGSNISSGSTVDAVHWATSTGLFTSGPWSNIPTPTTPSSNSASSIATTTASLSTTIPTLTLSGSSPAPTTANTVIPTASPASTVSSTASSSLVAVTKHRGLSGGAVAGVAIGCLVAGALIAGILLFLCFARPRNRGHSRDQEGTALAFLPQEKGPAVKAHSVESSSPVSQALLNGLSQPLEDKAIMGDISKLENLIKNHVQSYYHTRQVSAGLLDLDEVQALGSNLPVSPGTLSALLSNPETRHIALRFVIAWIMISRIELHADPRSSFLPAEVAECYQAISNADGASRSHGLFLANWRRMTAELLQSAYGPNTQSASNTRSFNIGAAANLVDPILRTYADPQMDSNHRYRNLEEIFRRAAAFAFTLFAQPSAWAFDWKEEQGVRSGSLCIFPALLQVSDETGEYLKPPRPFSEAMVRSLDG